MGDALDRRQPPYPFLSHGGRGGRVGPPRRPKPRHDVPGGVAVMPNGPWRAASAFFVPHRLWRHGRRPRRRRANEGQPTGERARHPFSHLAPPSLPCAELLDPAQPAQPTLPPSKCYLAPLLPTAPSVHQALLDERACPISPAPSCGQRHEDLGAFPTRTTHPIPHPRCQPLPLQNRPLWRACVAGVSRMPLETRPSLPGAVVRSRGAPGLILGLAQLALAPALPKPQGRPSARGLAREATVPLGGGMRVDGKDRAAEAEGRGGRGGPGGTTKARLALDMLGLVLPVLPRSKSRLCRVPGNARARGSASHLGWAPGHQAHQEGLTWSSCVRRPPHLPAASAPRVSFHGSRANGVRPQPGAPQPQGLRLAAEVTPLAFLPQALGGHQQRGGHRP